MRFHVSALAMAAFIGVAALAPASAAPARHDHGEPPAAAALPAQRWATDKPLREGMRGIRVAVEALGHYEHGHGGPKEAAIRAGQIKDHVNAIIADCKLPPEADAALHAIIVPLLRNAGELKRDPRALHAIAPMRDALAEYDRRFDDADPAKE